MTISIDSYFGGKQPVRKKEPQYLAFINRNSCTSCNACATMCPVDCIYEVPGPPAQSYHVVDLSRCIGCQMCYRVPSESTGPWPMLICPWNAIDMIFNPNFKERSSVWEPYYQGSDSPNFAKLEELGYDLYLNRETYIQKGSPYEKHIAPFTQPVWSYGEGVFTVATRTEDRGEYLLYSCTSEGDELVDYLYRDYRHVFLD
jgi:ferredoxin